MWLKSWLGSERSHAPWQCVRVLAIEKMLGNGLYMSYQHHCIIVELDRGCLLVCLWPLGVERSLEQTGIPESYWLDFPLDNRALRMFHKVMGNSVDWLFQAFPLDNRSPGPLRLFLAKSHGNFCSYRLPMTKLQR